MLKASFLRWIFISISLLVLAACSGGGDSSSSSNTSGRSVDIQTQYAVSEGASGTTSELQIGFVAPVTGSVTFNTFNVTAAEKSDFLTVSGEMSVVEGLEYFVVVEVYGDDQIEGDELVGLSLKLNDNEVGQYFGRILNDDYPSVTISSTSVLEGDVGTSVLTFIFRLDDEVVDPYNFTVVTPELESYEVIESGSTVRYAQPDVDFQSIDETITFTSDQTEVYLNLTVIADNVLELDERVQIEVTPQVADSDSSTIGYGLIRTDDSVNALGFDLEATSSSEVEGSVDAGSEERWTRVAYQVTVKNPENIIEDQNVQYQLYGSVENGDRSNWAQEGVEICANNPLENESGECLTVQDYMLEVDTQEFEISIYVLADLEVEQDEDITVLLKNNQGIIFGEFRHTIKTDDVPSLNITYTNISGETETHKLLDLVEDENFVLEVLEGTEQGATSLGLQLSLEYPLDDNYVIDYVVSVDRLTGADASDYSVSPSAEGAITIDAGEALGDTITLTIESDNDYEGTEYIFLDFPDIGQITLSILDNDLPDLEMKASNGSELTYTQYGNNLGAIDLKEQDAISSGNSLVPTNRQDFILSLSNSQLALTDLVMTFNVSVLNANELTSTCEYLLNPDWNGLVKETSEQLDFDVRVLIEGEEVLPNQEIVFTKGSNSLDLTLEVVNDSLVECIEFFALDFSFKTLDDTETIVLSRNFAITNLDKAQFMVAGWTVTESEEIQQVSYVGSLDQAIITNVSAQFSGSGHACNTDMDIVDATYLSSSALTFDGTEKNYNFLVSINGDSLVEPTESCYLEVTAADTSIVDICDSTGCDPGTSVVATGVINDNDIAVISFTEDGSKTSDCDANNPESCSIYYQLSSTHEIASNSPQVDVVFALSGTAQNTNDYEINITDYSTEITTVSNSFVLKSSSDSIPLNFTTPVDVSVLSDTVLETSETIVADVSLSTTANNIVISSTENQLNESILQNGDLQVTLILNDVDGSDTMVSEQTANPFSYSTNTDIGDLVEDIALNVSVLSCAANTICVNADDYTVSTETLYIHEKGALTDAVSLLSPQTYSKFSLNNESIVEFDEEANLQFQISDSNAVKFDSNIFLENQVLALANGEFSFSLQSEDVLNVTIARNNGVSDTTLEGDSGSNSVAHTITWDKAIGANHPNISFSEVVSADNEWNLAELGTDYTLSIPSIHTQNFTDGASNTSSGNASFNLEVTGDLLLEPNEIIKSTISAQGVHDDIQITGLSIDHTISNNDSVTFTVTKNAPGTSEQEGALSGSPDDASTPDVDESRDYANIGYTVAVSNAIADNYPEITLLAGSNNSVASYVATLNDDYVIQLPSLHDGLNTTSAANKSILLSLLGDGTLEPDESLSHTLTLGGDGVTGGYSSFVSIVNPNINYTIENDENLVVTISKDQAAVLSSSELDLDGSDDPVVETIAYTMNLSNPIASNYPEIALSAGSNLSSGDDVATQGDDYQFVIPTLHTASTTVAGDRSFQLEINGDETLEPDEVLSHTFSLVGAGVSGGFSTNVTLNSSSVSYTIIENDILTITLSKDDSGTLASEEADVDIDYTVNLSHSVAANYPEINLSLGANLFAGSTAATLDTDYALTVPDIHTGSGLTASGNRSLTLRLNGDTTLEPNEGISHTVSLSGSGTTGDNSDNVSLVGTSLAYTINNDDSVVVTVTAPGVIPDEGDVDGPTNSDTYSYAVSTDFAIADNYGSAISLQFGTSTCLENCATSGTDFTALLKNTVGTTVASLPIFTGSTLSAAGSKGEIELEIERDDLVEWNEFVTYPLNLVNDTADISVNFNSTGTASFSHEITNDDTIDVTISTSDLTEGDNLNDEVTATIAEFKSGLPESSISLTVTPTEIGYFTEALDVDGSISNLTIDTSSDQTETTATLVLLDDDDIIEQNESFSLLVGENGNRDIVNIINANPTYTVFDNDKLSVEVPSIMLEDNLGVNQPYYINLCTDIASPTFEGTTSPIINYSINGVTETNTDLVAIRSVSDSDLVGISSLPSSDNELTLDLTGTFSASDGQYCLPVSVFSSRDNGTNNKTEPAEWLELTLSWPSNADERFETTNFAKHHVLIVDNDYPYMAATGVEYCLDGSGNRVGSASCYTNGTTPTQDLTRSEQGRDHPAQHFSIISNGANTQFSNYSPGTAIKGTPAANFISNEGDNGYCLLDSYSTNIWLVGGFSIDPNDPNLAIDSGELLPFYSEFSSDKTALTLQTEAQSRLDWCGLASDSSYQWRLPTVDELISILNIEQLRGGTELSDVNTQSLMSYFQNHVSDNAGADVSQTNCELSAPTTCAANEATNVSSWYWSGEYCLEDAAVTAASDASTKRTEADAAAAALTDTSTQAEIDAAALLETDAKNAESAAANAIENQSHVWAVDFASGDLSCRPKTDNAHVRLIYK